MPGTSVRPQDCGGGAGAAKQTLVRHFGRRIDQTGEAPRSRGTTGRNAARAAPLIQENNGAPVAALSATRDWQTVVIAAFPKTKWCARTYLQTNSRDRTTNSSSAPVFEHLCVDRPPRKKIR